MKLDKSSVFRRRPLKPLTGIIISLHSDSGWLPTRHSTRLHETSGPRGNCGVSRPEASALAR